MSGNRAVRHAVTTERHFGLADARCVLALAEALPRSPDAVALLLAGYCRQ
jgi:hypothetical protein